MENFKRMSPFMMDELENLDFKKILTNEQMDDRYKTDAFEAFKMHIGNFRLSKKNSQKGGRLGRLRKWV